MSSNKRLVVIGGVAAGMSAASSFKRMKPEAEVIVLEKDYFISYGACSLPYYISDDVKDINSLISLTPKAATEERGITVLLRHEAAGIDPAKKEITVNDLKENQTKTMYYDKLIIATGGLPVKPPLPGIDFEHICTIRTLRDGIEIKRFIDQWMYSDVSARPGNTFTNPSSDTHKRAMKAVIVGGGYIGMEMCESLKKRGLDVTVFEKLDRVLGNMDTSITGIVEEKIRSKGVILYKGASVEGFEGENGMVMKVVTDQGSFDADLVVLAIGTRPNTNIALAAGMLPGAGGAIKVDEFLRTNIPDIFAAGDCAEATQLVTGKKIYIPLGTTANKQGRIAGENAAGASHIFEGVVGTAVTKIFDLEVARTGLSPMEADREAYHYFVSTIQGRSRSNAYPAGKPITVTYIVEEKTGRLLGAQMAGVEGIAHRIDTLATCLYNRMTVEDVARLDLGYAPPFATVWDPILIAANVSLKKLQKTE